LFFDFPLAPPVELALTAPEYKNTAERHAIISPASTIPIYIRILRAGEIPSIALTSGVLKAVILVKVFSAFTLPALKIVPSAAACPEIILEKYNETPTLASIKRLRNIALKSFLCLVKEIA